MNTRVAVPLTQEAYDAVSFLADLQGVSRGRFLADILEAAVPGLLSVQAAFKAAMAVEGEERAALVAGMAEAERRLLASLSEVMPEAVEPGAARPAPARPRGGRRAGGGRSDPPVTNRGVPNSSDEGQGE